MKKYIKPELTVREIRVSENLAGKLDLWEEAVWTKFDMLSNSGSPVVAGNMDIIIQEIQNN